MKNKTLRKSMQRDSRVDKLLLPFYNLCLCVHACVHLSVGSRLWVHHGVTGFLPPFR